MKVPFLHLQQNVTRGSCWVSTLAYLNLLGTCLQVVLDGTKKISSDELFTVLDKDSENTAFSTDIRFCPEKVVFSQQLLLLHDLNNVLACCCYFVEKNLVGLSFR